MADTYIRGKMKDLAKAIRDADEKKKRLPVHTKPADPDTFKSEDQKMKSLGREAQRRAEQSLAEPDSFKKGGKVKKTGMAKVHKGEKILTKKQAAKPIIKKAIKKK